MIVVLILGILATAAVPQYGASTARFQADAAARRVKADLEYLRHVSRRTGSTKSVIFNPTTHSYTLSGVPSLDLASRVNTVNLQRHPYQASLLNANCGGDLILVFDGFGAPDSSATITVGSGNYTRNVEVEAVSGKVTLP